MMLSQDKVGKVMGSACIPDPTSLLLLTQDKADSQILGGELDSAPPMVVSSCPARALQHPKSCPQPKSNSSWAIGPKY